MLSGHLSPWAGGEAQGNSCGQEPKSCLLVVQLTPAPSWRSWGKQWSLRPPTRHPGVFRDTWTLRQRVASCWHPEFPTDMMRQEAEWVGRECSHKRPWGQERSEGLLGPVKRTLLKRPRHQVSAWQRSGGGIDTQHGLFKPSSLVEPLFLEGTCQLAGAPGNKSECSMLNCWHTGWCSG